MNRKQFLFTLLGLGAAAVIASKLELEEQTVKDQTDLFCEGIRPINKVKVMFRIKGEDLITAIEKGPA